MKDNETVVEYVDCQLNHGVALSQREFNEVVNMTAGELEEWLEEEQSEGSGWDKGDGSGETVGHEREARVSIAIKRSHKKW